LPVFLVTLKDILLHNNEMLAFLSRYPETSPTVPTSLAETSDVFISYSTADSEVAETIAAAIRKQGYNVFLAHQTITVGPQWEEQVAVAARSCAVAVLVISNDSKNSDWVKYEIGALWALNKQAAPALIGLRTSEVPGLLRKYQGRPESNPDEITKFCNEVVRLLANV